MQHRNVVLLSFHLDTIKFTKFHMRFDKMSKCNATLTKYPTCVDSGSAIINCVHIACAMNLIYFEGKKNKNIF